MKTILAIAAIVLITNAIAGIIRARRVLRAARAGIAELAGRIGR